MIKKEEGFSLVELMITMVVFLFAIAAASQVFTGLLNQFKQQSKVAENNIEGMVGLDILRRDLQNAGFGLPWNVKRKTDGVVLPWTNVPGYNTPDGEAVSDAASSLPDASCFNDAATLGACTNGHGVQAPRPIVGLNWVGGPGKQEKYTGLNSIFNRSDYLVIKSASVATNSAAGKWQELFMKDAGGNVLKSWPQPSDQICRNQGDLTKHYPNSRVIVISPGNDLNGPKALIITDTQFFTYADGPMNQPDPHNYGGVPSLVDFSPGKESDVRTIYGIDTDTDLRMPFNRADYFIMRYGADGRSVAPSRCAPNTGVLEKVVISHADGRRTNFLPLLDCVADMQIVYGLDMSPTPTALVTTYSDGDPFGVTESAPGSTVIASPLDAFNAMNNVLDPRDLRRRLQEVRIYILAHEGAYDRDFNFSNFTANGNPCGGCTTITVGESAPLTRDFDLTKIKDADDPEKYKHYRWKLYTLVVKPNLAGFVPKR